MGIIMDWLAALESGEYSQGFGAYEQRDSDGTNPTYCALGVVGALYAVRGEFSYVAISRLRAELDYEEDFRDLPSVLLMNDDERLPFAEIAAKVREVLGSEFRKEG